jgi:hypothetical protein
MSLYSCRPREATIGDMGRSSTKMLVTEAAGCDWKGLYTIGGVTTIATTLLFLCDIVFWIMLGPYPSSAQGWFALLEEKRLVGFLLLSFPTFFGAILYYLTFLGLYHILRRVNPAYAALAALLAFAGLTILLVTHMAYPMVYLSAQHAAASTETQRSLLLAAGETRIAVTIAGVNLGGFLAEGAAVIFSLLMLQSDVFGKRTACLGIVGHGLDSNRYESGLLARMDRGHTPHDRRRASVHMVAAGCWKVPSIGVGSVTDL